MDEKTLRRETLNLVQLSSMPANEKVVWTMLVPEMETAQLEKLHASLKKEVDTLTDIYLETVAK